MTRKASLEPSNTNDPTSESDTCDQALHPAAQNPGLLKHTGRPRYTGMQLAAAEAFSIGQGKQCPSSHTHRWVWSAHPLRILAAPIQNGQMLERTPASSCTLANRPYNIPAFYSCDQAALAPADALARGPSMRFCLPFPPDILCRPVIRTPCKSTPQLACGDAVK